MERVCQSPISFLQVGWNRQFLMMSEFGFVYDATVVPSFSDPPIWPYTLDYRMPHICVGSGQLCPTRAYPGLWEIPLNQLLVGVSNCLKIITRDIVFPIHSMYS